MSSGLTRTDRLRLMLKHGQSIQAHHPVLLLREQGSCCGQQSRRVSTRGQTNGHHRFLRRAEARGDSPAGSSLRLSFRRLRATSSTQDRRHRQAGIKAIRHTTCIYTEQATPVSRGSQLTRREVVDLHTMKRGHLHTRHGSDGARLEPRQ